MVEDSIQGFHKVAKDLLGLVLLLVIVVVVLVGLVVVLCCWSKTDREMVARGSHKGRQVCCSCENSSGPKKSVAKLSETLSLSSKK